MRRELPVEKRGKIENWRIPRLFPSRNGSAEARVMT
jgi:hypothetical protein